MKLETTEDVLREVIEICSSTSGGLVSRLYKQIKVDPIIKTARGLN